jgi:hypothetical protein
MRINEKIQGLFNMRNIEPATKDTIEDEDEQVQESKGEDCELDTNTL